VSDFDYDGVNQDPAPAPILRYYLKRPFAKDTTVQCRNGIDLNSVFCDDVAAKNEQGGRLAGSGWLQTPHRT